MLIRVTAFRESNGSVEMASLDTTWIETANISHVERGDSSIYHNFMDPSNHRRMATYVPIVELIGGARFWVCDVTIPGHAPFRPVAFDHWAEVIMPRICARETKEMPSDDPFVIRVWSFRRAPKPLQVLSPHAGDEDWVALVPPALRDASIPWLQIQHGINSFGVCDTSEHEQADGSVVYIGAHA